MSLSDDLSAHAVMETVFSIFYMRNFFLCGLVDVRWNSNVKVMDKG